MWKERYIYGSIIYSPPKRNPLHIYEDNLKISIGVAPLGIDLQLALDCAGTVHIWSPMAPNWTGCRIFIVAVGHALQLLDHRETMSQMFKNLLRLLSVVNRNYIGERTPVIHTPTS